jgi:hypothetical protein
MSYTEEYTLQRVAYEDGEVTSTVEHTFTSDELTDILQNFTYFLMGCSFTYVKGLEYLSESD